MTLLYIVLIFIMILFKNQAKMLLEAIIKLVVALADALVVVSPLE